MSKQNVLFSHFCDIVFQINSTRCPIATANVVCSGHDDERLPDLPASSDGMVRSEDSLCKNVKQLSEGELGPNQLWTTAQHNHRAWGKFYELVSQSPLFCPLSGQSVSCCQGDVLLPSARAPVLKVILPLFAQQADRYFLSYTWHLTQTWDVSEASRKLPMAKASSLFLAL